MTPDALFQLSGPVALLGWAALVLSPFAPRLTDILAGLAVPFALSVGYAALILTYWADGTGGFGSLPDVMALFTHPGIALAGWVHYLAFDLFVGAWITRTARTEHISHLFVLPCLALTFLFGPAGFLTFTALRAISRARQQQAFP